MFLRQLRPRVDDLGRTTARHGQEKNVFNLINMLEVSAVIISSVAAAIALLVTTCCYNVRRLRCATIECCGAKCIRENMSAQELEMDTL